MKKLLLMILPAFICAGSLFAQTSTVSGVWERGKTKAVKMFKIVEGGNLSEVATSALGEDGSFQMTFTPEQEGYFVLGTSSSVFQNRRRTRKWPVGMILFFLWKIKLCILWENTVRM